MYGGRLPIGEREVPGTLHVFSCDAEQWRETATTGVHPPPGLHSAASSIQNPLLFLFGGLDGEGRNSNVLYQLDSRELKWRQLSSASAPGAPLAKVGCGMVYHAATDCLVVFGGRGDPPTGPAQPGAQYEDYLGDVLTNKLHLFQLQEGEGS